MAVDIDTIVELVLETTDEYKVLLGKFYLEQFIKGLEKGGLTDKEIGNTILNFAKLLVSADQDCSEKEYNFFINVTGIDMSYEDFFNRTNNGKDQAFIKDMFDFVKILTRDDRFSLIFFGIALLSSDDTLTVDEQNLFRQIIETEYV